MENHNFSWGNPLFLWSCSIANYNKLPEINQRDSSTTIFIDINPINQHQPYQHQPLLTIDTPHFSHLKHVKAGCGSALALATTHQAVPWRSLGQWPWRLFIVILAVIIHW